MSRKGLSLIEVLIAVSLFAVVTMVASTILMDIVQLEKRTTVQNAVYEDLRIMLQILTKEIQSGTIDYDEYYNYCVIQKADSSAYFGINHGVYGSRFFDPGKTLEPFPSDVTRNPEDLGLECSYMGSGTECEVVYTLSTDLNTGQNPFYGDPDDASAFHDRGVEFCVKKGDTFAEVDHLFLIDNTGTQKTLISRKKTDIDDWALGMVRMRGIDVDQNGLVDTFTCMDEFTCNGATGDLMPHIWLPYLDIVGILESDMITTTPIRLPNQSDLVEEFDVDLAQFVPISPMRADIVDLQFIVKPLEDPYKGFAEPDFRTHPTVTIILTVGLSDLAEEDYPGDFEPITVQTTIAAGVTGRIETYPPVNEILLDPGVSTGWIDQLGIPNVP